MLKSLYEQEMRKLIAFYRTPTGKKALKVLSTLQREFNTQVQNYNEILVKKVSAIMQEKGYVE